MHMCVGLGDHELIDDHRTRFAHPSQIIAFQIDEHDVLGALLRMGYQCRSLRCIFTGPQCARPGPGDGARVHFTAADAQQPLGG